MSKAQRPALVVLAAGIGSRYGGLKQVDPIGPHGEIVIDYSLYDALRAGFGSVVFVIRRELEAVFREHVAARFAGRLDCRYVYQEMGDLPAGVTVQTARQKPWGTGHAVLAARQVVDVPFCVVNADDFYGAQSFAAAASLLTRQVAATREAHLPHYGIVGFVLSNTLSEHGYVSRGVCTVNADGLLQTVVERTRIERVADGIRCQVGENSWQSLRGDEMVSMNLWTFTPAIFPQLETQFRAFLAAHGTEPKAEFFLPSAVDALVKAGAARVFAALSPESWFGVTYPQDKPTVVNNVRALIAKGVYPENLWG